MQTYFKYLNNSIIVYSQPLITRPQNSLKALSGGTVTSQCLRLLLDSSISPLKESYAGICFLISPTLLVNNAHSWIASTFIESIFCALFEKPPVVKCWELALPFFFSALQYCTVVNEYPQVPPQKVEFFRTSMIYTRMLFPVRGRNCQNIVSAHKCATGARRPLVAVTSQPV